MIEKKPYTIVSTKKSRYILPNLLTLIGVCLGISSIKFALDQNYSMAVIFIVLAALLDALDGRVARLIKGTSEFGKELDSLTDFVSFGIAPAFIVYFWDLNKYGKVGWALTLIFAVCCVLRLARFNLTKISTDEMWRVNFFEGIPSPAGGILILLPLIYELSNFTFNFNIKFITPYLVITIAVLLISKVPTFSFKKISIPQKLTIFILFGAGLIFVSLVFFTFETLVIMSTIYLFSIPFSYLYFSHKNKEINKKLNDEEHEDIL
jgi:CDP-diacylglycerol---serine O-phosphatidyltransferase